MKNPPRAILYLFSDKRGNLAQELTKNKVLTYAFDGTDRLVKGMNENGDASLYTYNALFIRISNTQVANSGQSYSRDFVIDYTSGDGTEFDYMKYDAWGLPMQPNKLVNNDHGNYITANFTGRPFDTVISFYYVEAWFYDPGDRAFVSRDSSAKDGINWIYDPNGNISMKTSPEYFLLLASMLRSPYLTKVN